MEKEIFNFHGQQMDVISSLIRGEGKEAEEKVEPQDFSGATYLDDSYNR